MLETLQGQLPILVPLTYLLFAFVSPLAGLWKRSLTYWLAVAGGVLALAAAGAGLAAVLAGGEISYHMGGWAPPIGIEYVLDPLSAFMAAVVTGFGLLAIVSSRPLLRSEAAGKELYLQPLELLLLGGLSGIVATGDLFNLYVFLEIASLAAYALIGSGDDRHAPMAAFRYVILGSIGGGLYLLGVALIYFVTGSLNFADVATLLPDLYDSRVLLVAAVFMVLGLGLKMALFPLHFWLPDAYTHAPYAVSSLIAPVMTKVSAYAIVRLFLDVFRPAYLRDAIPAVAAVGWLSAAGVVVAAVLAIAQRDYRRMLAYSSVSQVGLVGVGIGLGNPLGLIGALLHVMNHAFMKGCLFLVGGAVRVRTGATDVPSFAGLGRAMPWTMGAFTVAALSMVGIPPTAGFFSKWYLALASVDARNWVFLGVVVVSSVLTAVYFFRLLENVYEKRGASGTNAGTAADSADPTHGGPLGTPADRRGPDEPPPSLLGPISVAAAAIVVLGLANAVIVREILARVAAPLAGS